MSLLSKNYLMPACKWIEQCKTWVNETLNVLLLSITWSFISLVDNHQWTFNWWLSSKDMKLSIDGLYIFNIDINYTSCWLFLLLPVILADLLKKKNCKLPIKKIKLPILTTLSIHLFNFASFPKNYPNSLYHRKPGF